MDSNFVCLAESATWQPHCLPPSLLNSSTFLLCLFILACPNPTCDLQFPDDESVCVHLSQPGTACREWTHGLLDIMVQDMGGGRGANDMEEEGAEEEDQGMFITKAYSCIHVL